MTDPVPRQRRIGSVSGVRDTTGRPILLVIGVVYLGGLAVTIFARSESGILIGTAVGIVGFVWWVVARWQGDQSARDRLERVGIETTAHVVGLADSAGDSGPIFAEYRFDALGTVRDGRVPLNHGLRLQTGDEVPIAYDPDNPEISGLVVPS